MKMDIIQFSFHSLKIYDDLPKIYIISVIDSSQLTTIADLTRMKNTLQLVPKLCWILVEKTSLSNKIKNFLKDSDLEYVHLFKDIDYLVQYTDEDINIILLNVGLNWLKSAKTHPESVVHFIQIDNTYETKIFEEVSAFFSYP